MLIFLKILSLVGFIVSCIWWWVERGFEPMLAVVGCLSTFIGSWAVDRSRKADQSQTVGVGGIGIQVGGNAAISDIKNRNQP